MPNAVDTGAMNDAKNGIAPAHAYQSLEGTELSFSNDQERRKGLDDAFDYRGDVTLRLSSGATVEGFVFNRNPDGKPPQVQLFVKDDPSPRVLPYADILGVLFSGRDPADGKSYQAWKEKKHGERVAESKRVEEEMRKQGFI